MAKIVAALLARNEAGPDRYLARALANAQSFCDAVVVLDDGSTDGTGDFCRARGAVVTPHGQPAASGWWGRAEAQSEAPARQRLWELASAEAGPGGWIYVFDADHELLGISPAEVRALTRASVADCWACPLWDCWSADTLHRVDGHWQAWHLPRPWLFRALPGTFGTRGIHVGHAPFRNWVPGLMPDGAGIRHLGYVKQQHRLRKFTQYLTLQEPVTHGVASAETD